MHHRHDNVTMMKQDSLSTWLQLLLFSLTLSNLMQCASRPLNTFRGAVGSSTIDYIALPTCLTGDIISCSVLEDCILNTSDHNAVMVKIGVDGLKITYPKPVSPASIRWNKIDRDTLSSKYTGPADISCCDVLRCYEIGKASPG